MNTLSNIKLAFRLAIHDQRSAFKRTSLGLLWLILTPLILLSLYTLVFGVFLGVKWSAKEGVQIGYIVPMFIGLVMYLMFSELITSSTNLLVSKRNLVHKSSFPVWVLILSNFIRCSLPFAISLFFIWMLCLFQGLLSIQGFFNSLIALYGVLILLMGMSTLFALIGPFAGDLSQGVRLGMRVFFYTSPVTYPLTAVPQKYQFLISINPLTFMIEPFRNALLYQKSVIDLYWLLYLLISIVLLIVMFWMFQRVKGVLCDVV